MYHKRCINRKSSAPPGRQPRKYKDVNLFRYSIPVFLFPLLLTAAELQKKLPDLQHLTRPSDTTTTDSFYLTTLDSARFVRPPSRTVLNGEKTTLQLLPRCPVDSVILFVRHSFNRVDTLARLYRPPYRVEWDYTSLPDQDQIHLQFGYRLFHPDGKIITSKPLPHQWAIERKHQKSGKTYHCRQITPPDTIIIDGRLDEWKRTRRASLGSSGRFAFRWTSAFLYFAAEITAEDIDPSDFIEVHLDPLMSGGIFADERHRSIRFGPRSRSFCIVACDSGTGYRQCDSIVALLNEGLSWRTTINKNGYVIEAAIPFFGLSEREFPLMRFGCDITLKSAAPPSAFISWAGSSEYTRYNPGNWGTITLHQAMLPLKIIMSLSGILIGAICLVIVVKLVRHLFNAELLEREEHRGGSEELRCISNCITGLLENPALTIDDIARETTLHRDTISGILQSELDCSFDHYLQFQRINKAKQLLWDFKQPLTDIAHQCGYPDAVALEKPFTKLCQTDPTSFRENLRELSDEKEQEETGDKET